MTSPNPPCVLALHDAIRQRLADAACAPTRAARHAAAFDAVPELKARIDATLAGDPHAAAEAMGWLRDAFGAFKCAHEIQRLPYSPQLDSRYPYRDESSRPVPIVELRDPVRTQARHALPDSRVEAVMRYVDPNLSEHARADSYHSMLRCRMIGPADLRDPREHALVGERGVFAVRAIDAGECVGVYGGRLMSAASFFCSVDDSFVLDATSGDTVTFVDGENILAMANTTLAYDEEGAPIAQAEDGYNVEAVPFDAQSRCGRRFSIRAFFARRDIAPGDELRWNYRYSTELVRQVFGDRRHRGLRGA